MIFSVLLKTEPSQAEQNGRRKKRGEQGAQDGRGSKELRSHHITLAHHKRMEHPNWDVNWVGTSTRRSAS
jgi:hypothetical protein